MYDKIVARESEPRTLVSITSALTCFLIFAAERKIFCAATENAFESGNPNVDGEASEMWTADGEASENESAYVVVSVKGNAAVEMVECATAPFSWGGCEIGRGASKGYEIDSVAWLAI